MDIKFFAKLGSVLLQFDCIVAHVLYGASSFIEEKTCWCLTAGLESDHRLPQKQDLITGCRKQ